MRIHSKPFAERLPLHVNNACQWMDIGILCACIESSIFLILSSGWFYGRLMSTIKLSAPAHLIGIEIHIVLSINNEIIKSIETVVAKYRLLSILIFIAAFRPADANFNVTISFRIRFVPFKSIVKSTACQFNSIQKWSEFKFESLFSNKSMEFLI